MRVIVCGSRTWHDRHAIETWLAHLADLTDNLATVTIVTGFAAGADRIAHQEALKAGLLVEPHPADWQTHGKAAGPVRNERMAELGADLCVAFRNRHPPRGFRGADDMSDIDPYCLHHGKRRSEHEGGRCLYCCICFKTLTPEECWADPDGQKWDMCEQCGKTEGALS